MLSAILFILLSLFLHADAMAAGCDDADRLIEMGNNIFEKDRDKAYGFYNSALSLCPESPNLHFNLGLVYVKANHLDKAAAEFQKVIELKPDHDRAYTNLAWVLIEKERGIQKGIEIVQKRLKEKEDPKLMALLGIGLYRTGKGGEAIQWMLKAAEKDPANKEKYESLLQQMVAGKTLPQAPPDRPASILPADEKLPPLRPDTYAIIIGIDYKEREDIPHLQYASSDAKKVYDILTDPRYGGIPKEI